MGGTWSGPLPIPGLPPFKGLTLTWNQMPGALKNVSVGDAAVNGDMNNVVGANAANQIYIWRGPGDQWSQFEGSFKQISTGAAGIWAVNAYDQVFTRRQDAWVQYGQGSLKQVASGKEVYAVAANGGSYRRDLRTGGWRTLVGPALTQIDTNDDGDVWGVDFSNQVLRLDAKVDAFELIPGPNGKDIIKQVTTGHFGVWALDTSGALHRWVESDTKEGVWLKQENFTGTPGAMKYISSGFNSVWGCDSADNVYKLAIQ